MEQQDRVDARESKALALKYEIGREKSELLNSLFEAPLAAAEEAITIVERSVSNNIDSNLREAIFMREAEAKRRGIAESAKERYLELELEEQAGLEEIAKEAREILTPNTIDTAAVINAAALSEEQLISAADSVAHAGDAAADTLLTLLSVALERDLDAAVHHISELNEEWSRAVLDLSIVADNPGFDEDELEARFEAMTPDGAKADGAAILAAAEKDVNLSARLK
jgi:hypothetical protein